MTYRTPSKNRECALHDTVDTRSARLAGSWTTRVLCGCGAWPCRCIGISNLRWRNRGEQAACSVQVQVQPAGSEGRLSVG